VTRFSATTPGMDRVTGTRRYAADLPSRDALHVAFVAATEPHALLVSIDTSVAEAMDGVELVLTGSDIGDQRFGTSVKDYPILAVDRVLFAGQRVAAVAARDVETARAAAERIVVEYEALPRVNDVDAVMWDDVPELHPHEPGYEGASEDHPTGNLQGFESIIEGDLEAAFARCDQEHEATYVFDRSHSAPLEPHSCLVEVRADAIEVWSSNKVPNRTRKALADLTGREPEEIVVHPARLGGDFGSKSAIYLEAICTLLSDRASRPVRATLTYTELLTATAARHPGFLRVRTGVRDGKLLAYEGESLLDGGAFAGIKPRKQRVISIIGHALAPYDLDARDERVVVLYTNNLPGGHVRSPGEFQAVFAGESHIDEVARRLGEDPIEFRLRNCSDAGSIQILNELGSVVGGWGGVPDTGTGVALFSLLAGRGQTSVSCEATIDGVELKVGVPDQGAGMYDSFRRLAAEELRIPLDRVDIRAVGADAALPDSGAGSSRVTAVAGNACLNACKNLLRKLGEPPSAGGDSYWIADALGHVGRDSCSAEGTYGHDGADTSTVPESHGGIAVEVAVDRETGTFKVRRALLAVASGRVANPIGFRGQLEGGFVYGLSQALYEQLIVEEGQVVTASLGDYKVACVGDVPPLEVRHLRLEGKAGEQLAAVGELANLGVAPAIANAIDAAVGVRLRALPLTAEAVWRGLLVAE
jgi:aerobic carbon-monoxide dehydrogenase large subunit